MSSYIDPPTSKNRSVFVWDKLDEIDSNPQKERYVALARGLASMILRNGLGPTLAFLCSKSNIHRLIYDHLHQWLFRYVYPQASTNDLLEVIIKSDSIRLKRATDEALQLAGDLRRLSEARFGNMRNKNMSDTNLQAQET